MSAAIFIAAFFVYGSNGDQYVYSYDSAPNSLLVLNALENHRLDFDNFSGGYFDRLGAGYVFMQTPTGRRQSIFPIGTAIVAAPVYLALDALAHVQHRPLVLTSIAFERQRLHDEKTAAGALAALAAVLMFWCLCEFCTVAVALLLTAVFAFGTSMWTIGSQALWQHGPVNLVLVAMTLALVRAERADGRNRTMLFVLGGIAAGFLTVVRPTAFLFTLAALVWVLTTQRRDRAAFAVALAAGAAPGIAWNVVNFHSVAGGYAGDAATYRASADVWGALAALAISPSKGLFVYLPVALAAPFGAVIAARSGDRAGRLLTLLGIAGLLLAVSYGFYTQWWGGSSFGPRFLTDLDAIVVLLLAPVVTSLLAPRHERRTARRIVLAAIAVAAVWGVGVQIAGANGESDGKWSATPSDVDTHLARIWNSSDMQIARDARAAYRRIIAPGGH